MIDSQTTDSLAVLNRLFRSVYRSLPAYLEQAHPWPGSAGSRGVEALDRMAADHRTLAERLAEAILDQGGPLDAGRFPMEFTDLHDVSLDFLLGEIERRLEQELPELKRSVYELAKTPALHPLADDVRRTAQEHLAMLKQLRSAG